MAPREVHFVRHAEGYHNSQHDESIPDPDLTPKGQQQARDLSTTFPYFDRIDLVCASPIRRAIQTALLSMDPYLNSDSGRRKIVALPLAQESTDKPANTPSSLDKVGEEYGDVVDFTRCKEIFSEYNVKRGIFAPESDSLEARARELRCFLRDRDEDEVVVVSHGDFLHHVSGDVDEEGEQVGGDWENAEVRSFRFEPVGHEDALMRETEESVKLRGAKGPGLQKGGAEN
jgi:broad specificity phosphatase PhoE